MKVERNCINEWNNTARWLEEEEEDRPSTNSSSEARAAESRHTQFICEHRTAASVREEARVARDVAVRRTAEIGA
jgi:tetrahydrodipicolinate N-succinyltransferase